MIPKYGNRLAFQCQGDFWDLFRAAARLLTPLGQAASATYSGSSPPSGGLPRKIQHWSLTTLREKLIKIGAKVVRHSKYVTFQLAEVAVPRGLFAAILERIYSLRWSPGAG